MKKFFLVGALFALILVLPACGKKQASNEPAADEADTPNTAATGQVKKGLTDWLRIGRGVECRLETPQGEVLMIAKDDVVRIEGKGAMSGGADSEFGAENSVILTTKDWTYFWDEVKKEGTKISRQFGQDTSGQAEDEDLIGDWEEMTADWERENVAYDCKEIVVSDAKLLPPADVTFTDLGEVFAGMAAEAEKYDTDRIEGLDTMNQEELEAEMDKILNKQGME